MSFLSSGLQRTWWKNCVSLCFIMWAMAEQTVLRTFSTSHEKMLGYVGIRRGMLRFSRI